MGAESVGIITPQMAFDLWGLPLERPPPPPRDPTTKRTVRSRKLRDYRAAAAQRRTMKINTPAEAAEELVLLQHAEEHSRKVIGRFHRQSLKRMVQMAAARQRGLRDALRLANRPHRPSAPP
eukprot:Hpha_TRINITY_DN8100_c0_g1::TRINITY_DN8100_c0_g1_i1::g.171959::m.171959